MGKEGAALSSRLSFRKLFEPGRIGEMELKNRMVMPAMGTNLATRDGYVNEQMKDYYEERAKGGVGLVIVEVACVDPPTGKTVPCQLLIDDDKFIPGLSELAEVIHRYGAKAALQLMHAGRAAKSKVTHTQPVAPSAIPMPFAPGAGYEGEMPRELTVDEIKDLVGKFGKAAQRAKKAGFDGVEIHSLGLYLVAQFLSSASNRRQDDYGGELKNRARFLLDTIKAIKEAAGQDYPAWCRLTVREFGIEGGITLEEGQEVARRAQEAGADAIHVTVMAWGVSPRARPPTAEPPGNMVPFAEAIKKVVTVPVIAVGRINPELGERVLQEGKADFIAIGKGLISDPELPRKAASGRIDEIRPCIGCLRCIDNILHKDGVVQCTVNAAAGKEREYQLRPVEKSKEVLVVGGGPAGMEAARVTALRGHRVTLYEKQDKLGGQLLQAIVPPYKNNLVGLIDYLATQMVRQGVKIELGIEATPELIEEAKPEVVLLATGVTSLIPEIPGIHRPNVVTAQKVLEGEEVGERVVVIGGELVGCEIAEYLAERGKKVTIVEILTDVATRVISALRGLLLSRLAARGVTILTGVKDEELTERGLAITTKEGEKQLIEADTVVLAAGAKPNKVLLPALEGKIPEIYSIGDCVEPRDIFEAIADGYHVGRRI
jgi:2,4-dienoyl-CoA reductase-like NADH-dependent reductase (Old Yellow Enzyme family)/thioredoxin reductase